MEQHVHVIVNKMSYSSAKIDRSSWMNRWYRYSWSLNTLRQVGDEPTPESISKSNSICFSTLYII